MSKVTELTDEIINDYMQLSGMRLSSPDEYMLFRNQAIKEIDMRIDTGPVKQQITEPVPQSETTAKIKQPVIQKEKAPAVPVSEQVILEQKPLSKEWNVPKPKPIEGAETKLQKPQKTEKASSGFLSLIDSIEC